MVGAALRLVPNAEVGLRRAWPANEETFQPMPYLAKLPERLDGRPVFVLDPMLATGGSLGLHRRAARGAGRARADHRRVRARRARGPRAGRAESGIDLRIVTASIDSHLNELAYIVPGLGDAGDRQFGLW